MVRFRWVFVSASLSLALAGACSDDEPGGNAMGGSGGSASGNAGSSGASGSGGSAGTTMSNAGSGGGEAAYTAAEACQRFAEVTHQKGVECGLVIPGPITICLAAIPASDAVSTIAAACEGDLGDAPRNAADVDRCLAGIADNSCEEACSDAPFEDCEAFAELPGGGDAGSVVMCRAQCLQQQP